MRGAFAAAHVRSTIAWPLAWRARTPPRLDEVDEVWLVDDVVTSGATLRECARALRRAGAHWVGALALARADGAGPSADLRGGAGDDLRGDEAELRGDEAELHGGELRRDGGERGDGDEPRDDEELRDGGARDGEDVRVDEDLRGRAGAGDSEAQRLAGYSLPPRFPSAGAPPFRGASNHPP